MTHTVFLDDIAELVKDSYSPRPNENLKYIGLEHINQQSLSLNGVGNSRELGSNKYRFRAGDILFGKLRPYFRKVYRPDFEGVCSTDIWVLRPKGDTDPDFLFYLIASEEFVSSSSGASTGTRMPRADWSHVSKTKWTLPNNPNVVGRILRSLDEKIEFNRQMNETLEQIGQALFRHYFIDNPEAKTWRTVLINDQIYIKYGKNLSTKNLLDKGYPVFGGNGRIGYFDKYLYERPVVLVSCRGEASGKVNISEPKAFVTNNSLVLDIKETSYLTFEYLKHYSFSRDNGYKEYVTGSAQPQVTVESLSKCKMNIPPKNQVVLFTNLVRENIQAIGSNEVEIRTLTTLRDTLLPRLISGKIKV